METALDIHAHIGVSGDGGEGDPESLLRLMDENGIERAVIMPVDDGAGRQTYAQMNDEALGWEQRHPGRFTAFWRVNPREGRAATTELERGIAAGARGLKLHPYSDRFEPEDAAELVGIACASGLPVILHTGHQENCRPQRWCELLAHFPQGRFLLSHGGKDAYRAVPDLLRELPHVWVDTTTLSFFRSGYLLRHLGSERVIFGSDYPYSHPFLERKKLEMLAAPEDWHLIFRANALRFLGEGR